MESPNITSNVSDGLFDDLANSDFNSTLLEAFLQNEGAQELAIIILHLIGMCADFFLIYTAFFNPKYRTAYVLIANWALANLFSLLINPIIVRTVPKLKSMNTPELLLCVLPQIGGVFKCSEILFLMLLLLGWYISVYHSDFYIAFKNFLKIIVILLWILTACIIPVVVGSCMLDFKKAPRYVFDVLYISMCALLVKLHATITYQTYKKETAPNHDNPNLGLNITSMFVFIWGPDVLDEFVESENVLSLTANSVDALSPICMLAVLFGFEKQLKIIITKFVVTLRQKKKTTDIELENPVRNTSVSHTSNIEVL